VTASEDGTRPVLRVIGGGDPNDEEVAALVAAFAVVTARTGTRTAPASGSRWASRERGMRRPLHPGPGAWRGSARPN
jgi:hypothetical protein